MLTFWSQSSMSSKSEICQQKTFSHKFQHAMTGFELTTLVVIGTECSGSCKSNYHTITTMTVDIGEPTLLEHLSLPRCSYFSIFSCLRNALWTIVWVVFFFILCWSLSVRPSIYGFWFTFGIFEHLGKVETNLNPDESGPVTGARSYIFTSPGIC
jgi:hypothetical protein